MSDQLQKKNQIGSSASIQEVETITNRFSTYLKGRGYRDGTCHAYCAALSHFLRWLLLQPSHRQLIDSVTVGSFLRHHLPICQCLPPVYKDYKTVRAALNKLLLLLGKKPLHFSTTKIPPTIKAILCEFDAFLLDVCGLSESTRHYRQRFVSSFLIWLFGNSMVDASKITPEAVVRFVIDQADHLKPSSIGVLLTALRSYLRFLRFNGHSTVALPATVPRPPNWSLAALPPCLNEKELVSFLATFDLSTPIGKRDYGMARCLIDLGLRCHEVAALKIDDIDWRHGIVELRHNKHRRDAQIPLPGITGRALVDYLRNGRPGTISRSIFVIHRAPLGRGVENTTVRGAIRRAFSRAGLSWTGTHILRHTMATKMIQNGVSLKEIADVLRHQDINTTQIYTKVNLPELQQVAMPWPRRQ